MIKLGLGIYILVFKRHIYCFSNKKSNWYNAVINDFIKLWKTVEKERVTGYDHRKPKSKGKKINTINIETKQKNIKQLFNELPDSPKVDNGNVIIRVRTQSFDNK